MKGIVYTDVHLREVGSFPGFNAIDSNGLTRELNNILLGADFVADAIRQHDVDLVFCLGDLFHNTDFQTARTLHASHLFLGKIRSACELVGAEHYIIAGNHDTFSEECGITSISNLGFYFTEIVSEPTVVEIRGFKVLVLPFSSNIDSIRDQIDSYQDSVDLIVTHMDFAGATYESGQQSNSMLSPESRVPIISGDIHMRSDVGNVHYTGSLIQNRFNRPDLSTAGGITLFDEHGNFQDFRNTYSKHYVRVRDLEMISELNPDEVVLQIITEEPKHVIEQVAKGFEYTYIRKKADRVGAEQEILRSGIEDPKTLMRDFVKTDNPDALPLYEDIAQSF